MRVVFLFILYNYIIQKLCQTSKVGHNINTMRLLLTNKENNKAKDTDENNISKNNLPELLPGPYILYVLYVFFNSLPEPILAILLLVVVRAVKQHLSECIPYSSQDDNDA